MLGSFWVAAQLAASQEELSCMKLASYIYNFYMLLCHHLDSTLHNNKRRDETKSYLIILSVVLFLSIMWIQIRPQAWAIFTFWMLYYPVLVHPLRCADPPSKKWYHTCQDLHDVLFLFQLIRWAHPPPKVPTRYLKICMLFILYWFTPWDVQIHIQRSDITHDRTSMMCYSCFN
jgi:hypothetical protein